MSAAQRVLERLAGVKQSAPDRWMARCPAHEDKSPSLSIREMGDGRVLINCFGGCGARDVLDSIDLRMSDLFDKPIAHHLPPIRGRFSARELVELTAHETTVAAMLALKAQSAPLSADDAQRLRQAAARLGKAQAMVNGG
jgi:hypothetical protein